LLTRHAVIRQVGWNGAGADTIKYHLQGFE
jgi:hypothetical protein